MENKSKSGIRNETDEGRIREDGQQTTSDSGRKLKDNSSEAVAKDTVEPDKVSQDGDENIHDPDKEQRTAFVDNMVASGTSRKFAEAVADFDEENTEPQPAELWEFNSAILGKRGSF